MRIRPILFLLLCATGAAAQVPTLTNAATIKFAQGNTIFSRSVADVLALVGAENISVTGNWTFSSNLTQLKDAGTYFYDDATPTKLMRFQLSGITAATTRNLTVPDADGTIALTSDIPSLPISVSNGGTGATSLTNNRLLTGNGTSAIVDEANLTFDGTLLTTTGNQYTTGALSLGTSSTAYKLRVRGAGATSATNSLLIENSTPTSILTIRDDTRITLNQSNSVSASYDGIGSTGTITSTGNSVTGVHNRYSLTSENDGTVTGNSQYGVLYGHTISALTQSSGAYGIFNTLTNNSTAATGQMTSMFFRITENENTTTLNNRFGCRGEALFTGSGDFHNGYGVRGDVTATTTGRWNSGTGFYTAVTDAITSYGADMIITNNRGTANTQRGIRIQNNVSGSGVVVDNAYGIELRGAASSSGIITNYFGIYQNTVPAGATNTYFLYGNQSGAHSYLSGSASLGVNSTAAKLTVRGTGTTSSTTPLLVENSSGTDIVVVTDDQMAAIGTATVSTQKLTVRGATSDNTTKAFVAERSSGTDVLGVQNDGKVSINNAAYTEELTINGQAQLDGVIFTSVTASTTASGHMVYTDNATHGGYMTIGDGDRQLALMPTMIERDVIDYNVDWTTGRKGSFWTVPARFNGWKISKVYIGITNIGSGAGDDELSIEIGGVVEGVQIVTAGTHTLVMDDVINTDDIITFNITEISATPAKGLNVALELAKN